MNTNTTARKKSRSKLARTADKAAPLFPKTIPCRFGEGDKVRIKSGPYNGAEGVVVSTRPGRTPHHTTVKFRQLNGHVIVATETELEFATASTRKDIDRLDG